MFRKMRRSRQQLSKAECLDIIQRGQMGILAVLGDDGYPYTVPLNYVYADGRIYFHCAKSGHKLDALERCDKVSFCVIDRDDVVPERLSTDYKSVVIFGRAHILQAEEMLRAATLLGLRYNPDAAFVKQAVQREHDRLCCIALTIEHMTGKEGIALTQAREKHAEL